MNSDRGGKIFKKPELGKNLECSKGRKKDSSAVHEARGDILNRGLGRQACHDKACGFFLTHCAHYGIIMYPTVTLPAQNSLVSSTAWPYLTERTF